MSREGSAARLPPHRAGVFVLGKFLQQREEPGFPLAFGSKTLPWVDVLKRGRAGKLVLERERCWDGRDALVPVLTLPFPRYDSLTGVPSHQRALAFEKGSVLFNIGALHTQIGARQDRATLPGLNQAIDAFQKAAGTWVPLPLSPWRS